MHLRNMHCRTRHLLIPALIAAITALSAPLHAAEDQTADGQAPQEQLPQQSRGYFIIGRVVAVDSDSRRLVLSMDEPIQDVPSRRDALLNEQQTMTVRIPEGTTIILDDERCQLEDLQAGDEVLIRNRSASRDQGQAMRQIRGYRLLKLPSFSQPEQSSGSAQSTPKSKHQQSMDQE